jgi:hypothetical protein
MKLTKKGKKSAMEVKVILEKKKSTTLAGWMIFLSLLIIIIQTYLVKPTQKATTLREFSKSSIAQPKQSQSFDPFSDFVFRVPKKNEGTKQEGEEDAKKEQHHFSSYHCVGTGTTFHRFANENGKYINSQTEEGSIQNREHPNYTDRQCHYKNLYYRLKDQTFHYFASPTETKMWKEKRLASATAAAAAAIADDVDSTAAIFLHAQQEQHNMKLLNKSGGNTDATMSTNLLQDMGDNNNSAVLKSSYSLLYSEIINRMNVQIGHARANRLRAWRPILHENPIQSKFAIVDVKGNKNRSKNKVYFALYHPFHSMNIGHLLWDDLLATFSLYDRLIGGEIGNDDDNGLQNDQIIPFFVELPNANEGTNFHGNDDLYRCSPANWIKWQHCVKMYKR